MPLAGCLVLAMLHLTSTAQDLCSSSVPLLLLLLGLLEHVGYWLDTNTDGSIFIAITIKIPILIVIPALLLLLLLLESSIMPILALILILILNKCLLIYIPPRLPYSDPS